MKIKIMTTAFGVLAFAFVLEIHFMFEPFKVLLSMVQWTAVYNAKGNTYCSQTVTQKSDYNSLAVFDCQRVLINS